VHLYCLPLKFILRYGVSRFFFWLAVYKDNIHGACKFTYSFYWATTTRSSRRQPHCYVTLCARYIQHPQTDLYTLRRTYTRVHTRPPLVHTIEISYIIYMYIYRVNIHTTKTYLWYTLTDVNCSARTRWTNHSLPNNARAPAEQVSKQVPEIIKKSNRTPGDGPVRAGVSALRRNSNERTTFQVSRMVHGAR